MRAALLLTLGLASGCASFSASFDRSALRAKAELGQARGPRHGPRRAWPFSDFASLERRTRPGPLLRPRRRPLSHDRRPFPGLIQEELRFRSAVPLAHPESNVAQAYLYRRGPLGARPLVIFAPGLYVSEAAMTPVGWLIDRILEEGADVLFYVPPYHLGRTPRGWASGDAVLATDVADHLGVIAQGVSDLRRLSAWLKAEGVTTLGGFGGSMGGSFLLQLERMDGALDFLSLLIPLISWEALFSEPEEFAPLRALVADQGYDPARLARVYRSLDPSGAPSSLNPQRISVFYARYDQVAPRSILERWADAWGVRRRYGYDRGHALILLTPALYDDYQGALHEDLRALR